MQDSAATLSSIEAHLRELPLLPVVVMKMMTLDSADERYFEEIAQLAGRDPTFAVRLIRVANSSALATRAPITNLKSALVRLGTSQVTALVTSIAVMRIFVPNSIEARCLWLHSLQVAIAARALAVMCKSLKVNPDDAYLSGLLHDIGRFVMLDCALEKLKAVDEAGWDNAQELLAKEQELCGFDHAQLGARICSKWHLPEQITNVVGAHHRAETDTAAGHDPQLDNLLRVIGLADTLSIALLRPAGRTDIAQSVHDTCAARIEHDPIVPLTDLQSVAPDVLTEADRQFAMLGLPSI